MMNWLRKWRRPDHRWPKYLPGGRLRTSTAALVIAFAALSWLHEAYQPPAPASTPETAVVPPGFVPDPQYTWVPRTNVRTRESEPATTTTATPTSPTESTSPDETTTPTGPSESTSPNPTTSLTPEPDGWGQPSPQTGPQAPSTAPSTATTPAGPVAPTTVPPR